MSFNPKVALFSGQTQNIDYTAGSAVSAGDVVVINGVAHFAQTDIAASGAGALAYSGGVWKGNKITGAISAGDALYWDAAGNPVTGTAGTGAITKTYAVGLPFLGFATAAALSGDSYVYFVKAQSETTNLRIVSGQSTTVAASDTIVSGLSLLVGVVATFDTDPADANMFVSASIGDQAGTPAAGSFLLKTWKSADGTDPTPVAASSFSKKVNWIAFGK